MTVTQEIAARYLAVSHEPDPAARQAAVTALWSAHAPRMMTTWPPSPASSAASVLPSL